jgi:hypothetical protein
MTTVRKIILCQVLFVNVSIGSRFECPHCELAQVVHHLFDKLLHFVDDRREYCAFQRK